MNLQGPRSQTQEIETQTELSVSKPGIQDAAVAVNDHHEPRFLRALHVIDAISRSPTGLSLAHLSEQLHIPKATLMRLLQALEEEGFLLRQFERQAFTLGPAMAGLSLRALQNGAVAHRYRPVLNQLVQRLGETCNLTAPAGDAVVYLDRVETSHPLRMTLATGTRVPLHCTASGKLFLAEMPVQSRNAVLEQLTLSRMTDQTLCDIQLLKAELERVKRQGYGVDNEEFIRGMVAVAVPIRDLHGHCVAAVACHAPTARYGLGELVATVGTLKLAAVRITDML
jgi:IclR family transcriptional regulator, acetate operon repressor